MLTIKTTPLAGDTLENVVRDAKDLALKIGVCVIVEWEEGLSFFAYAWETEDVILRRARKNLGLTGGGALDNGR